MSKRQDLFTHSLFQSNNNNNFVVQPCDHKTSRNRTRQILRLPASPRDSPCPDLVQSEPCILNSTCFTHQYRVSGKPICTAGCRSPPEGGIISAVTVDSVCIVRRASVDWSTCQLSENAVCGEGFRLRLLDCIRSDGKIMELHLCEQVTDAKIITIRKGLSACRKVLLPV